MEISHGLSAFTLIFLSCLSFFIFSSNPFSTFSSIKLNNPLQKIELTHSNVVTDNPLVNRLRNLTLTRKVGKLNEVEVLEMGLARARAAIRKAMKSNVSFGVEDDAYAPTSRVYRNPSAFHQSYVEMEKRFKVYVYEEGDRPFVHGGPCKDIYTSEGRFIHEMEFGRTSFRTRDPKRALVYFLPFSVAMMVKFLWNGNLHDKSSLLRFVADYVRIVSTKYPYWNRTQGADHFMLSCHDWGPEASQGNPSLYKNSIRVLCNANTSEGFDARKDVSLPEVYLKDGNISPELATLPPEDAPRPHLGFFAGGIHGPIRPILLQHWKARDPDLLVYEYLPKNLKYYPFMLQSKYCLCPSGWEVASPRIVEAIYAECVPVTISDHYVLPFSDVLRWETFSVRVEVTDIPKLKEILMAIPEKEYRNLKEGVRAVKKHFVLNQPPKRFDVFHMILHSIWLRRLDIDLSRI